jgi:hypothetical protein
MGPMARRKSLRSQLYRAARDLGNVEAAEKGPTSHGKWVVRRKVYRFDQRGHGAVAAEAGALVGAAQRGETHRAELGYPWTAVTVGPRYLS